MATEPVSIKAMPAEAMRSETSRTMSSSVFKAIAFDDHERQIVHRFGFADEAGEGFINPVAQTGGGASAILLHDFDQEGFAELFVLFVDAFGHTIRVDHQHIAGFKLHPPLA